MSTPVPLEPVHAPESLAANPLAAAALQLVERWSEAARAQAIYPAGHHRVSASLQVVGQALEAVRALAHEAPLQIVFTGHGLLVQNTEAPVEEGGGRAWLRERLDHAALAGIVIGPQAPVASLAAVNERLLQLYGRRDAVTDVAAAWNEPAWPGIQLLDRRFEGVFEGEDATQASHAKPTSATQRTWSGRGATGRVDPQLDGLVVALLKDRQLLERLRRLAQAGAAGADAGGATDDEALTPRAVLGQLAALVRPEDRQLERAQQVIEHLVEALESRREGRLTSADLAAQLQDAELSRRASWLGSVLVRQDLAAEEASRVRAAPAQGPRGHAGDEQVKDDTGGFLRELAALPAQGAHGPLELASEELAVLLHLLTHHEDPSRLPRLLPALAAHLEAPDSSSLAVLASVLQATAQRADGGAESTALTRLMHALHEVGRFPLARSCGFLGRERVIEGFPAHFGDWLLALDPRSLGDQDELRSVLKSLGSERIEAHADALATPEQLGRPGLAARLLGAPLPCLAPLARTWLVRFGGAQRGAVVAWLRSLRLRERAAQVLDLVEDPTALPDDLLLALIGCAQGLPLPPSAQEIAVQATAEFVRAAGGREDRRARRFDALRLLGSYGSPEALAVLHDVLRRRRWFIVPVEDRLTRDVAAATLRQLGAA